MGTAHDTNPLAGLETLDAPATSTAPASPLTRARAAELRGELSLAATLLAEAGYRDEAARVIILRGDAEADAPARLRHYAHAAAIAPPGSRLRGEARRKHSLTVVRMASLAPLTTASRYDLARAAEELEAMQDFAGAAEAYAQAGDSEGQARMLERGGDIDGLEALLDRERARERDAAVVRGTRSAFALLVASGQRREAVDMARTSGDPGVRQQGRDLERRRLARSILHAVLRGQGIVLALGDEVLIGRAREASEPTPTARAAIVTVLSPVVSRSHLAVRRRHGTIVVQDVGSSHGTFLGETRLTGEAPVGAGIGLRLGREAGVIVRPTEVVTGAVAIEAAGVSVVAALGPARLGIGRWRLERAEDGWVELVTDDDPPAFAGSLQLAARITLVAGDAIASERGGACVLEISEHGA